MHHLLIKEVGHHRLLGLGQDLLQIQGVVVDQDRQVDQDHHHRDGHYQLLEVVNDQTLQLNHYLQQITVILTTKTIVSVVKVWD